MPLGLDAGTYRWGSGWDLSWAVFDHHGLEVPMSDETSDSYAHGHSPHKAVPIRHHIYRTADGLCELHITTEEGVHYLFSMRRAQAFSGARVLTNVVSILSDTGLK